MNIKQSLRKNKASYLVEEKMTSSACLSNFLTKKPQNKKERDIADQRLKSFLDQIYFSPTHLTCLSLLFPPHPTLDKHVVDLILRLESCIHWLFNSSMRELITDTL